MLGPSTMSFRFADLLRIGDGLVGGGNVQGDGERRLEIRFVETRKGVTRADRFHLRLRVGLAVEHHLVEAFQRLVVGGVERNLHQELLRLQRAAKINPCHAGIGVGLHVFARVRLALRVGDRDLRNFQVLAVQPEVIGGFLQIHRDRHRAAVTGLFRIAAEFQLIGLGYGPARQLAQGSGFGGFGARRCGWFLCQRGVRKRQRSTARQHHQCGREDQSHRGRSTGTNRE